jgi:hypothetical protein
MKSMVMSVWDSEWLEEAYQMKMLCFIALANRASANELLDQFVVTWREE